MPNSSSPHPTPLTPQERSRLRAAAHALRPVVLIGERGLSDAVVKEIDRALTAHQLIKVRAASLERDARDAMLADICAALGCHPVHHLGKMLILYRPAPVVETSASPLARKASQPYIPKKRAAAEKPADKTPAKPPSRRKTSRSTANSELVSKKTLARKPVAVPRTGSALSLRAGARSASRGIARSVGARKTSVHTTIRKTPSRSR